MKNISKNLQMFNQVCKETNVIYHDYAAKNGISDTAFWIMYSVYYYGEGITQKNICEEWFYSAQTVNSSLKTMEKNGLIILEPSNDNKKEKQIHFTKEGQLLAEKIIKPVIKAEKQSFEQLDSREIEVMFETTYKHMKKLPLITFIINIYNKISCGCIGINKGSSLYITGRKLISATDYLMH